MGIQRHLASLIRRAAQICGALALVALLSEPLQAQTADWKARWEQTVAAAKKEGEINISGPSGRGWREYLMKFQETYPEITVKITPSAGRSFWPRVMKEYEVGQYLWDLRIGGTDNLSYKLKGQGYLDSVRDELILPEVTDEKNWWGGMNTVFVDKEKKYYLAFVLYEQTIAQYNKKIIPGDLAFEDILDPKFTGKITMAEPHGGSPLSGGAVLYKVYGEDYIRKLITTQKLVISKEPRQQMQWLTSGRYPITYGLPTAALVEYNKARGANSADDEIGRIKGPRTYSHGVGAISLPAKRPHPNASTVFINWLLTKETQTGLMKAVKLNSRRNDVPLGDPDSAVDTAMLSEYFASQAEEMQEYQDKTAELFRQLIN
jgi:ABC-type Fe3+ transport system substrate-binding protein